MCIKLSQEYVRKTIADFGCTLIGEYLGSEHKISVRCPCMNEFDVLFHLFIKHGHSHRCPKCGFGIISKKNKNTNEEMQIIFEKLQDRGFYSDSKINCYVNEKIEFFDKEGYKYWISCSNLTNNGEYPEKFLQTNIFILDNINLWLVKNNRTFVALSLIKEYKNRSHIEFECKQCGFKFISGLSGILSGSMCPYCSNKRASPTHNLYVLYPFICSEWDYSKNKYNPFQYLPMSSKKVFWICSICNNSYESRIFDRAKGSGCPICKFSGGAKRIYNWIKVNELKCEIEKWFSELVSDNGCPLRYDFAIVDDVKNVICLIEFDHKQHYEFTSFFHKDLNDFILRKRYDVMKDNFAILKNIPLIRISYKDYDNIEKILNINVKIGENKNDFNCSKKKFK